MELFPKEFVPELNTKNLGNSASFLTILIGLCPLNGLENMKF
jgi:hypothetical protein